MIVFGIMSCDELPTPLQYSNIVPKDWEREWY